MGYLGDDLRDMGLIYSRKQIRAMQDKKRRILGFHWSIQDLEDRSEDLQKFCLKIKNSALIALGPCTRYAGWIWNAALFLRLGLPSTLIRHENGAFRRRSSNRWNLKTTALRFHVEGKHFENGALRNCFLNRRNVYTPALRFRVNEKRFFKNDGVVITMWFLCPSFPQTHIQNDRNFCVVLISLA